MTGISNCALLTQLLIAQYRMVIIRLKGFTRRALQIGWKEGIEVFLRETTVLLFYNLQHEDSRILCIANGPQDIFEYDEDGIIID